MSQSLQPIVGAFINHFGELDMEERVYGNINYTDFIAFGHGAAVSQIPGHRVGMKIINTWQQL